MNLAAGFFQIPINPGSEERVQVLCEKRIEKFRREIGFEFSA